MKRLAFIAPLLAAWFVPAFAMAAPGIPHQFYGTVSFENGSTPDGLLVEAKVNGTVVGTGLTKDGKYGYNPNLLLAVNSAGDWNGETIKFFVKGIDSGETYNLAKGSYTKLDLTIPGSAVPATPSPAPTTGGGSGGAPTQTQPQTQTQPVSTLVTPPAPQTQPVVTETKPKGQVLGASSLRFGADLEYGMKGEAVTELQKRLASEGVYSGPITGYFGPLTREAVKKYQEKNNIKSTGYFGPLTRGRMNESKVAGVSTDSTSREAQIASLKAQIAQLMKLVEDLLKARVTQTR